MKYEFRFFERADLPEIQEMILRSYAWDYPAFSLSRLQFADGLHPAFCHFDRFWERTVGVYREGGRIVACAINEGNDDGTAFFLFDSRERAFDGELLSDMLFFAQTTMSCVADESGIRRTAQLVIPEWNTALKALAEARGFVRSGQERTRIRAFSGQRFPVRLPEGYRLADGIDSPAFYRANVHMAAFHYSIHSVPDGERAFAALRKQPNYDPRLDLCALDPQGRPVAMANIWADVRMPYCELEPLGVAWWERRKGLATALLNEAANRVMELYPGCGGMLGGDQPFYEKLGFEVKATALVYRWEADIYPSWDSRSEGVDHRVLMERGGASSGWTIGC